MDGCLDSGVAELMQDNEIDDEISEDALVLGLWKLHTGTGLQAQCLFPNSVPHPKFPLTISKPAHEQNNPEELEQNLVTNIKRGENLLKVGLHLIMTMDKAQHNIVAEHANKLRDLLMGFHDLVNGAKKTLSFKSKETGWTGRSIALKVEELDWGGLQERRAFGEDGKELAGQHQAILMSALKSLAPCRNKKSKKEKGVSNLWHSSPSYACIFGLVE